MANLERFKLELAHIIYTITENTSGKTTDYNVELASLF